MSKTVVGLFSSMSEAERVKQELITDGYDSSDINVMASGSSTSTGTDSTYSSRSSTEGEGIGAKIEHFFSSLMGGDSEAHEHYASGVNSGGALLALRTDEGETEEVAQWLHEHGASNIDRNSSSMGGASTSGYRETAGSTQRENYAGTTGEGTSQTVPVIEEDLEVGKRTVNSGGVRVYSHVVEKPAEASVTLRDETINVERREVNRPATAADFTAGSSKNIEMSAQSEKAVVGKTARVVEEVVLGKQVSEHTEQVHDNVRSTEVEVEQIDGNRAEESEYAQTSKTNRY